MFAGCRKGFFVAMGAFAVLLGMHSRQLHGAVAQGSRHQLGSPPGRCSSKAAQRSAYCESCRGESSAQ